MRGSVDVSIAGRVMRGRMGAVGGKVMVVLRMVVEKNVQAVETVMRVERHRSRVEVDKVIEVAAIQDNES